jgi:HDOD domain
VTSWMTRLFAARRAAPAAMPACAPGPVVRPTMPAATLPSVLAAVPPSSQHPRCTIAPWLVAAPPPQERAPAEAELRALAQVRSLLDPAKPAAELLPRAGAVIPQLLAVMRQQDLAIAAMSDQVTKDRVLTAEVLRLASSAAYSRLEPPRHLQDAIGRIGTVGLRAAIARVVLKPILRGGIGLLDDESEARCWALGDEQAQVMAAACDAAGHDRFEGYMLGLVHGTGWTVALRAIDARVWPAGTACSLAFAEQLFSLKDRLFAKVAGSWHLSPAIDTLCTQALQNGLHRAAHPLASLVRQAELQAVQRVLQPRAIEPA